MHVASGLITQTRDMLAHVPVSRMAPALLAAVLGLVIIYTAGFAETHILHSAAHDARHSAGFPCH